jgi:hypothetical protein
MNIKANLVDANNNNAVQRHIEDIARKIVENNIPVALLQSTCYPNGAGVYCIFKDGKPIYVGESGNLSARIREIFRTVNHSFRRSLGKYLYSNNPGFTAASSSLKFSPEIEEELTEYMESSLTIVFANIALGRKEVEEFIYRKYQPEFNVRGQRG